MCTSLLECHQTSPQNIGGDLIVDFLFIVHLSCISGYLCKVGLHIGTVKDFYKLSVASLVGTGYAVCIITAQIPQLVRYIFLRCTPSHWMT